MKTLLRAGALALASILFACQPAAAQHASDSRAPAGFAPEQACVTWSGATIGAGTLVPCPASAGGGGGGSVTQGTTPWLVAGNVASLAADAGNPVKLGGVYSTAGTLASATVGNRVDGQVDAYGNLRVALTGVPVSPSSAGTNVILPYARMSNQATSNVPAPLGTLGFVWNGTNTIPQPGDANGAYMVDKGGSNMATGQASVTTASTLIATTRTGRQRITVSLGAANDCYFGNTGVTTTTGFRVKGVDGASLTINTAAAVYAVCAAATTISYVELY